MLPPRVIPCLQLIDQSLVKTVRFKNYNYIGDPINTVRIFNELEVDELVFLDIRATKQKREVNFKVLGEIANECFMPLSYGGAIRSVETAKKILSIGFEKLVINTSAVENPLFISHLSKQFGSQSIIGSIDIYKNMFGKHLVYSHDGSKRTKLNPVQWAKKLEELGAGELLITSINNDGTWNGYDLDILKEINNIVSTPVIANGGAGNMLHLEQAVKEAGVNAVAVGSMVVYQKKNRGVLVNFPERHLIEEILS